MVECPECGANADVTGDGSMAHCASCNNIFEPSTGKGERGAGSGSGDRPSTSTDKVESGDSAGSEQDTEQKQGKNERTVKKEWKSGIKAAEWTE